MPMATFFTTILLFAGSAQAEQDPVLESWVEEQSRLVREISETHLREPRDPRRFEELQRRFTLVQGFILLTGGRIEDVIQVDPDSPLAPQLILVLLRRAGINLPSTENRPQKVPKPIWRPR